MLEAATPWGRLVVPFDKLDRLSYVRDPLPGHRLILTDRSRLSVLLRGEPFTARTLRFGEVKLAPNELAGLVRLKAGPKGKEGEPEPPEPAEAGEMDAPHFVLAGENCLVGSFELPELQMATGAGVTPLDSRKIRLLERREGDEPGPAPAFSVELVGGGKLAGRFEESILPIRWGDSVLRVPVQHLLSFQVPERAGGKDEGAAGKEPGKADAGPIKEEF